MPDTHTQLSACAHTQDEEGGDEEDEDEEEQEEEDEEEEEELGPGQQVDSTPPHITSQGNQVSGEVDYHQTPSRDDAIPVALYSAHCSPTPAPATPTDDMNLPLPPTAEHDPPADVSPPDDGTAEFQSLVQGISILKHGRRGRPRPRVVQLSSDLTSVHWDTKKEMLVKDITGVTKGLSTQVLLRSGKAKAQQLYVSIVSGNRTLDMEMKSMEDRDRLHSLFRKLLS